MKSGTRTAGGRPDQRNHPGWRRARELISDIGLIDLPTLPSMRGKPLN
jgi:hypothetical protein